MTAQNWSLKIFSGAHIGAETELEQGSYILGSHEDCDFVLTDNFIAERQAEIIVSESGITIKSLSGQPLYIDGQDVGESCSIEKHQMVAISGLSFAFGVSGESWPDLVAAMPGIASTGTSQPPATDKPHADNNNQNDVAAQPVTATTQETTDEQVTDDHRQNQDIQKEKKSSFATSVFSLSKLVKFKHLNFLYQSIRRHYIWYASAAGLLSLLFVLSFSFFWLWEKTAPDNMHKPVNHVETVENITSSMNLAHLNVRQLTDGFVLISGYLHDNEQKNQLLQRLNEKEIAVKLKQLFVMTDMQNEATQALKTAGYSGNIQIKVDTMAGSLILTGYAANQYQITKIREILNTEVPGLISLSEQVEFQSTREKTLHTMLQEYGLSKQIKLLEHENKIILKGRLEDVSEGYYFKKVVSDFRAKYGMNPELIVDVTIPSASITTLKPKLTIKSISLGHTPYIILADGQKYLTGAKLENGYILESIGLDYLVLRLKKQRIKYYVRNSDE